MAQTISIGYRATILPGKGGAYTLKKMIALLSAALLALSVTACGNDQKNDANNANDAVLNGTDGKENTNNGIMGDMAQGTEDVVQGTEDAVQDVGNGVKDAVDGVEQGVDDMTDTAENAGKAMKRSVEEGGVSYGEMLDNARVHDTDGDLTDHENAVTPGWDG